MQDDGWQAVVRATLRASNEDGTKPNDAFASAVSDTAKRRVMAIASTRAAAVGFIVVTGLAICAYHWAQAETKQTSETILLFGAPWTP